MPKAIDYMSCISRFTAFFLNLKLAVGWIGNSAGPPRSFPGSGVTGSTLVWIVLAGTTALLLLVSQNCYSSKLSLAEKNLISIFEKIVTGNI